MTLGMATSLFKSDENMDKEASESIKEDARALFSLTDDKIKYFFDSLENSPETFTTGSIAKNFSIKTSEAYGLYMFFLHVLHTQSEHTPDLETIKKDLLEVGCEKEKVDRFIEKLSSLSKRTIQIASGLYFASYAVDDYLHIDRIASTVLYGNFGGEGDNIDMTIPIVRIEFFLEQDDKERKVTIYVPITEIEEFAINAAEIAKTAKDRVRNFKKQSESKLFTPEG